ncbi:MAG: DUF721 domain-containing protein [Desulfuromonas sp.]|mgnify:CR=1 FL=1|uniref:DUF721 domain-containing protein n=1 Tax=Desulfuromonas sp. TaxID=892 RepID=UPI000CA8260B|nr:DUF721 domain-containing protein [Desulfuromonas sp.]PLX82199.1 MAG: DUF721 domain-containing protein [Desulfuromonas sp.]
MKTRRPRMKRAVSAASLIQDLLRRQGLEGKLREYRAWEIWNEVVGPQIAARAQPLRIRDGVLEVRVDQAVWMQQLQLLKPQLLLRLNQRLGENLLHDIYLRRGKPARPETSAPGPAPLPWREERLSAEEQDHIDQSVAPLHDPELRNALRDLLTRQRKLARARQRKSEEASRD